MKVAQIVASLETRHGGPGKSARRLSEALVGAGNEVSLLSTSSVPSVNAGPPEVRVFKRTRPLRVCASTDLKHHLQANTFDLVHHHGLWLRTLHYAHQSAQRSNSPLVLAPRGMMSPWAWNHHRKRKWWGNLLLHPGALTRVSGWHATSQQEVDDIRALGFTQPICNAPNSVSIPDIDTMRGYRARWLSSIPETNDRPIALFYSRFHRKKRLLELIDLWTRMNTRDWILLVIGIPEEYSAEAIENYITNSGSQRKIWVFDGLQRPPPYNVASLYLLPSHSENFGLTIAEALAHGVPALVTDTTPWEEINNQEAGWCVPWDKFEETLSVALKQSRETLGLMGHRGRKWVEQTFSWETTARTMTEFYQSLSGN